MPPKFPALTGPVHPAQHGSNLGHVSVCPNLKQRRMQASKEEELGLERRRNTDFQHGSLTHRPYTAEDGQILHHLFLGQPRLEEGHQQRERLRRLVAFRRHVSWWKGKQRISMVASAASTPFCGNARWGAGFPRECRQWIYPQEGQ